jgi:hypothetical protein
MITTKHKTGVVLFLWSALALGGVSLAQDPSSDVGDAGARVRAVSERLSEQQKALNEARKAAKTPEEKQAAMAKAPDYLAYAKEFKGLAQEIRAGEFAAVAWHSCLTSARWVRSDEGKALGKEAADALLDDHADWPQLGENLDDVSYFVEEGDRQARLESLFERSKLPVNKAMVLATLADMQEERFDLASTAKAKELQARLMKEFADVADPRSSNAKETFGVTAERALDQLSKFGVGATAQEIEAADLTGVTFKLSDYRGKVVLLDFWGNW